MLRLLIVLLVMVGLMSVTSSVFAQDEFPVPEPDYSNKRPLDFSAFDDALAGLTDARIAELDALVIEATIPQLQAAFADGSLTSEELVTYYVQRIRTYDLNRLNAIIELNPDALASAREKDAERAVGGDFGPMHGIPVLLKDNIAAAGDMHWTAGAWALRELQPDRDAFLVQQLRASGAIIMGKTNLSEWANWVDPAMPNGFSTLGGQTRHPYGPFDPLGSSSGSAVSVAANLTAVAVGTETSGSIISPGSANSIVALKTSLGLVSRDYVVPLVEAWDVPGPMGRTVTDVAILLTAMTGTDVNDSATEGAAALAGTDFAQFLTLDGIEALRVGYFVADEAYAQSLREKYRDTITDEAKLEELIQLLIADYDPAPEVLALLEASGVELVPISGAEVPAETVIPLEVITPGFKFDLNRFLSQLGARAPYSSLEAIIAVDDEDAANRTPYGHSYLNVSQDVEIPEDQYRQAVAELRQTVAAQINDVMQKHDIDALLGTKLRYNAAGFPAITLPQGYDDTGKPVGLVLTGGYLSEPVLIQIAYAIEQANPARVAPDLETTIA
ncbi:MAG: hypothetical protein KC547_07220, partial [Anaerolineae bacterium]|nr:hypothetical protein [Anaerolineae bacterium]